MYLESEILIFIKKKNAASFTKEKETDPTI